jgi:hypothetical protein
MDSIGLLLNDNRLLMVLLRKGFRGDAFLHSYRLVSLRDVKPEDRDDIIVSNIEGFIDQTKSDRENLFLGIPGSKVIFKRITLPAPTEENLKEVLELCLEEHGKGVEDFPQFVGIQQIEVAV